MIASPRPYPKYRESGFSSIGTVPEHWTCVRLKRACRLGYGDTLSSDTRRNGGVPVYGSNGLAGWHDTPNTFGPSVLIGRMGSFGKVTYSPGPVFALDTAFFVDSRLTSEDLRWLCYALTWARLDDVTNYSAVPGLDRNDAYARIIARPPKDEQTDIATFLDAHDRLVGQFAQTQEKRIELLLERQRALVGRAVTRGLSPSVSLRATSLDWADLVPEHWKISRNGRLFTERVERGREALPILEVSLSTGVTIRDLADTKRKQMMTDPVDYKLAHKDDMVYNMMRMWQGAVGVAPVDGLVSPAYVVARPNSGVSPRYYAYLFRTEAYKGEVGKHSRGIVPDRNRLYWENFQSLPSLLPPPHEQDAIAAYADQISATIERLVSICEREVTLAQEYQTRLIHEVITGKLDVRGARISVPGTVHATHGIAVQGTVPSGDLTHTKVSQIKDVRDADE